MSKFREALRERFKDPRDVLRVLGFDEDILDEHKGTSMSKPTRLANLALQLTASAIRPVLAKDAKIDLMPIFKDVTTKNFEAKKITLALDAALKGKLAKDANMEHVTEMLDHLEHAAKPATADESVSEEQHKAMAAAAGGNSTLGIPKDVGEEFMRADKGKSFDAGMENLKGFLKEKGMGEDDINAACDMMKPHGMDAETDEEKKKKEEEAKKAEEKKAEDAKRAKDEEMKDMVSKPAMDEAIKAATAMTAKTVKEEVRATERGIRKAFEDVRPWVGELPALAYDTSINSAEDVLRHAAGILGIENAKTMHKDALWPVIKAQRPPGAKSVERSEPTLGMDAAAVDELGKMFPGIERIQRM